MNELRELASVLDGYVTETQGFAVEYAKHDFDNIWSLKLKAYEDTEGTVKLVTGNEASILTIAERLKRSSNWDLLKAEKVSPEIYEIEVARIKDEEETDKEK